MYWMFVGGRKQGWELWRRLGGGGCSGDRTADRLLFVSLRLVIVAVGGEKGLRSERWLGA